MRAFMIVYATSRYRYRREPAMLIFDAPGEHAGDIAYFAHDEMPGRYDVDVSRTHAQSHVISLRDDASRRADGARDDSRRLFVRYATIYLSGNSSKIFTMPRRC